MALILSRIKYQLQKMSKLKCLIFSISQITGLEFLDLILQSVNIELQIQAINKESTIKKKKKIMKIRVVVNNEEFMKVKLNSMSLDKAMESTKMLLVELFLKNIFEKIYLKQLNQEPSTSIKVEIERDVNQVSKMNDIFDDEMNQDDEDDDSEEQMDDINEDELINIDEIRKDKAEKEGKELKKIIHDYFVYKNKDNKNDESNNMNEDNEDQELIFNRLTQMDSQGLEDELDKRAGLDIPQNQEFQFDFLTTMIALIEDINIPEKLEDIIKKKSSNWKENGERIAKQIIYNIKQNIEPKFNPNSLKEISKEIFKKVYPDLEAKLRSLEVHTMSRVYNGRSNDIKPLFDSFFRESKLEIEILKKKNDPLQSNNYQEEKDFIFEIFVKNKVGRRVSNFNLKYPTKILENQNEKCLQVKISIVIISMFFPQSLYILKNKISSIKDEIKVQISRLEEERNKLRREQKNQSYQLVFSDEKQNKVNSILYDYNSELHNGRPKTEFQRLKDIQNYLTRGIEKQKYQELSKNFGFIFKKINIQSTWIGWSGSLINCSDSNNRSDNTLNNYYELLDEEVWDKLSNYELLKRGIWKCFEVPVAIFYSSYDGTVILSIEGYGVMKVDLKQSYKRETMEEIVSILTIKLLVSRNYFKKTFDKRARTFSFQIEKDNVIQAKLDEIRSSRKNHSNNNQRLEYNKNNNQKGRGNNYKGKNARGGKNRKNNRRGGRGGKNNSRITQRQNSFDDYGGE